MLRHLNILNILLVVVLVILSVIAYQKLESASEVKVTIEQKTELEKKKTPSPSLEKRVQPLTEYTVISEKNLFHPERRPVQIKEEPKREVKKPDIILYGTVVSGDYRIAFIEDLKNPRRTPGRGKRQTPVRVGDSIGPFTVKEIGDDYIILSSSGTEFVYHVQESHRAKHIQTKRPIKPEKALQRKKNIERAKKRRIFKAPRD